MVEYSTIYCRQFLQGECRAHIWRCMECQFPKCKLCDAGPESPVMFNHLEKDGSWYCLLHRYPPCSVCRITPRPETAMQSKMKFKDWTCEGCRRAQKTAQHRPHHRQPVLPAPLRKASRKWLHSRPRQHLPTRPRDEGGIAARNVSSSSQ